MFVCVPCGKEESLPLYRRRTEISADDDVSLRGSRDRVVDRLFSPLASPPFYPRRAPERKCHASSGSLSFQPIFRPSACLFAIRVFRVRSLSATCFFFWRSNSEKGIQMSDMMKAELVCLQIKKRREEKEESR